MEIQLISQIYFASKEHPKMFAAVWFTCAALLLTCPLIAITFLLLITRSFSLASIIPFLILAVLLPLFSTISAGALFGYRIIALPPGKPFQAAFFGLITGLAAFIIWILLIEVIPNLFSFTWSSSSGGDLPGAALVVAFLVILPGIVIGVMFTAAMAGILLHIFVSERRLSRSDNFERIPSHGVGMDSAHSLLSGLLSALPAIFIGFFIFSTPRDEYFWTIYAISALIFFGTSFLLGICLPAIMRNSHLNYPWLMLFVSGAFAWVLTLLSLALLNITPLCIGQDNGDGLNDFSLCVLYTVLVSFIYSPFVLILLSLSAFIGGKILPALNIDWGK